MLALVLLCLAQFMLILDVTVVNLALPTLATDLGVSASDASWAVTAYIIPFGGLLLIGGKLSDAYGSRRLFLLGLIAFTIASLFAGIAPSLPVLIAARVVQGIGAALLSPAALATVTTSFTGTRRFRALAIWGGLAGTGSAVGVLVGGLLTAGPGWRWVFLINLPVGLVIGVLVPLVVRTVVPASRTRLLDISGAALITIAIAALIAGITRLAGGERLLISLILITVAALASVGFWLHERKIASPLIPSAILGRRPIQAGVLSMLAATALMVGSFYLLSFLLQSVHHWSAVAAGVAFLPIALGTLVASQIAGQMIPRYGGRPVGVTSFLIAVVGATGTALSVAHPVLLVISATFTSLGIGAAFVSATTAAFTHVEHHETGIVSGVINTAHELGGGLGIAVLAAIVGLSPSDDTTGYFWAFCAVAVIALLAAAGSAALMPRGRPSPDAPRFVH